MKAAEARKLSVQELYKSIRSLELEAFKLRMKQGAGQEVRTHKFKELGRSVARIRTIISEKMREAS